MIELIIADACPPGAATRKPTAYTRNGALTDRSSAADGTGPRLRRNVEVGTSTLTRELPVWNPIAQQGPVTGPPPGRMVSVRAAARPVGTTSSMVTTRGSGVLWPLSVGLKDVAAARELGMSVRTYRRHVAEIMQRLNAISRFRAGVRAMELGLIGGDRSVRR